MSTILEPTDFSLHDMREFLQAERQTGKDTIVVIRRCAKPDPGDECPLTLDSQKAGCRRRLPVDTVQEICPPAAVFDAV